MTKDNKDLLVKVLCAMLPYKVTVELILYDQEDSSTQFRELSCKDLDCFIHGKAYKSIKPCLRQISSMTKDEVNKLFDILNINEENGKEWIKINDIGIIRLFTEDGKDFYEIAEAIDYLNSIHIDYLGLTENDLAIKVTEDNNPYRTKIKQ